MAVVPCGPGRTMGRMASSPYVICLGDAERAELESVSRRALAPFRLVLRSRIVLLAAAGTANRLIVDRLGVCEDTARKWRRRYGEQGIEGLADAPRPAGDREDGLVHVLGDGDAHGVVQAAAGRVSQARKS